MTNVVARPTAVVKAQTTWQEFPALWRELMDAPSQTFLFERVVKEKRTHMGQGGEEEHMRSSYKQKKTKTVWRTTSMDAPSVLWMNWHEQLKELLTGIHGHQKKRLAFFVLGIVLSGSAVMQRVAETLSERGLSEAKMTSIERRLARFSANERIVVPLIWKLLLEQVLAPFRGQKLYFVLDNTPFRDDLTMVYLGLLVHSRVLPVAWAVMPAQTTWDEGQWDIVGRLLDRVRVHLPDTSCTLIADRG